MRRLAARHMSTLAALDMNKLAALAGALAVIGCTTTSDLGTTRTPCDAARPCPAGSLCFNGLCARGCEGDADCAADQYCDTAFDRLCHDRAVTTCPATPCATSQVCLAGLCSTPAPATECTATFDGNDGCDAYSICFEEVEDVARCHTFPPCPEDGHCPVGLMGAVCNQGEMPGKAHICLTSMCTSAANCPGGFACILPRLSPLGLCSDGGFGMPCLVPADCDPGLGCVGAMIGLPGFCLPGGG